MNTYYFLCIFQSGLLFFFVKILIFPSGCNFSLPNFIPGICKLQFVFMRCFPIIFLSFYRIFFYLKSVEFLSNLFISSQWNFPAVQLLSKQSLITVHFFQHDILLSLLFYTLNFFFTQLLENLDQTAQ